MRHKIFGTLMILVTLTICTSTAYAFENATVSDFAFELANVEDYDGVQVTGTVYMPNEVKDDTVYIFIHGRAPASETEHRGFDYIIEDLTALGNRAISLNICDIYNEAAYNTQVEIDYVKQAVLDTLNKLKNNRFRELKFGEAKNIVLVGHSRGGFHAIKVAEQLLSHSYNIEHIISIAPCIVSWEDISTPNVETTIIVPEFDGDVTSLDGAMLYEMDLDYKKSSITRYLYLFGANHCYFSTEMPVDDGKWMADVGEYRIEREEQSQFLEDVVLKYTTTEENKSIELKSLHTCQEYSGNYRNMGFGGTNLISEDVEMFKLNIEDSYRSSVDKTWFDEPGLNYGSYSIVEFNSENAKLYINLNKSKLQKIIFDAALDSTKTESTDVIYSITVNYTDGSIKKQEIKPIHVGGGLTGTVKHLEWSRCTPLEQYIIELNSNLEIEYITIESNVESQLIVKRVYVM